MTPVVAAFAPSWVLVSAGFDAHRADPLADLALSAGDFATLATVVAGYAPGPGRTVLFLEGGYDLAALRSSVSATLGAPGRIAADRRAAHLGRAGYGPAGRHRARERQRQIG